MSRNFLGRRVQICGKSETESETVICVRALIKGKKAFRIGLAKFKKDHKDVPWLMKKFVGTLLDRGMITIEGTLEKPVCSFAGTIPISGALRCVFKNNVLLVGDAAGLCGAFAADGIKGAVISGKEGARLIDEFLKGDQRALSAFHQRINMHQSLMSYYRRQVRYRWIWNRMKRNRTFRAMYDIIASEKESFLNQFCDSKDRHRSLMRVVLKIKHFPKLLKYAWFIFLDL